MSTNAQALKICGHPADVREHVKLWAVNWSTGRVETDDNEAELRFFAKHADAFFEYDPDAPASSALAYPSEYGFVCRKPVPMLPMSIAVLPPAWAWIATSVKHDDPCRLRRAQTTARTNARFLALPNNPPACDKPAKKPAASSPKGPMRVPVCARPKGVPNNITEWAMVMGTKTSRMNLSEMEFAKESASAKIIFYIDENAPPESIYYFVDDVKKLRCPGKPEPKPFDDALKTGAMPLLREISEVTSGKSGAPKKGTSTNGSDDSSPSASPDGQGPPLNFVESLSRNLAILSAMAQGDTSGSLSDPNGSRYGAANGKNVGGPNLLATQIIAGAFGLLGNPLKNPKEFIEAIAEGLAKRESRMILNPKVLTKEVAEKLAAEPTEAMLKRAENGELIESYGKAMAMSLQEAQTILPYCRAKLFTAEWAGKYQAHHILEKDIAKRLLKMEENTLDDIPAIILTEAQHKQITGDLRIAYDKLLRDTAGRKIEGVDVWKMYQEVYKDQTWLKAIEHYFQQ